MSTSEDAAVKTEQEAPTTRQSPLDIIVISPSGASVVIAQQNPVDPVSFIRQGLTELQETAPYTCYHFELTSGVPVSDYIEVAIFAPLDGDSMTFTMVPDSYDVKTARSQIKKVREILSSPPVTKGAAAAKSANEKSTTTKEEASNATESSEEKKPETTTKAFNGKLPTAEELFAHPGFESFYEEALLRTGKPGPLLPATVSKAPSDSVKSVAVSGWNPPAPARRTQGDLLYIEVVTAEDGIFHITANPTGFFVNKSTRYAFDPSPAQNAHFSHELLYTLIGASAGLRNSWTSLCAVNESSAAAARASSSFGPLDGIASAFNLGRGDQAFQRLQWNLPPGGLFSGDIGHVFDISRAQDDLADNFGVDDHGAPREWNEELQSIRALVTQDPQNQLIRARFSQKTVSEFTEASKQVILAVCDGHITAMNPTDPVEAHVYIYNNLFVSRVTDTKENFKLFSGDEANRKGAAQDLKNQRTIQALGIEGVFTGLTTIVDYKGERFMAQTVIPGVLSSTGAVARLMYGTLDPSKRVSVKTPALDLMKEVGKKLFLPLRNISPNPITGCQALKVHTPDPVVAGGISSILGSSDIEGELQLGVKADDDDEVVPPDSASIPHIGPIEGKMLLGTDERLYTLEVFRITPRDANFVKGKGTGLIVEEVLAEVDVEVAKTYVLRQELITHFVQHKIGEKRKQIIQEVAAAKKERDAAKAAAAAAAEGSGHTKDADGDDEEEAAQLTKDVTEKLNAITPDIFNLEINPNVFFEGVQADVDPAVVEKDEDMVRNLSTFLLKDQLVTVTNQIRTGDIVPIDNESLVSVLHTSGINMRYLGELARLALGQESEDKLLLSEGKQRIQGFPLYWLELLECEILARSIKHHLAALFRARPDIRAYPAQTIATLLNHIFGTDPKKLLAAEDNSQAGNLLQSSTSGAEAGGKSSNKKKKSKSQKAVAALIPGAVEESTVPTLPDAAGTRLETLAAIRKEATSRFLYPSFLTVNFQTEEQLEEAISQTLATLNLSDPEAPASTAGGAEGGGGGDKKKEKKDKKGKKEQEGGGEEKEAENIAKTVAAIKKMFRDAGKKILSGRLSPITLLRRVCRVTGVRIATRKYDFESATPFSASDIITLIPLVKSCEPLVPLPEAREFLSGSRALLVEGNYAASFELLQQATNAITQITGPVHKETLTATDLLCTLFIEVGDLDHAINTSSKALALAVQLFGLDSQDSITRHMQLGALRLEQTNVPQAINHLTTAKYLVETVGGSRHTYLIDVWIRLANLYEYLEEHEMAIHCFGEAKKRCKDVSRHGFIGHNLAELVSKLGDYELALSEQREAHRIFEQLFGPDDERTVDAKTRIEVYRRRLTESKLEEYKQAKEIAALKALEESQAKKTKLEIVGEMSVNKSNSGGVNGGSKGGSKKKGVVKKGARK